MPAIFYEDDKFNMIKNDFIIEITKVSLDSADDMQVLGYTRDYINTDNFRRANIRLNYVLLKNKDLNKVLKEIREYIDRYPNIKTVSLKTLNLNTKDDSIDNPYSQWIIKNGMTKADTDEIIKFISNRAEFKCSDEKFFDRYEWVYSGVPITFYAKKLDYGISNIVFYGGKLVDYHLNKINIHA